MSAYLEKFQKYFQRDAAQKAARSIGNGCEIELRVGEGDQAEILTFYRENKQNHVRVGAANDPHLLFVMPAHAANEILSFESSDIGEIGIHLLKLVVSKSPEEKVHIKLKTGLLTLATRGYFGVLKTGGMSFAKYLTQNGLGLGAIKDALKKSKG